MMPPAPPIFDRDPATGGRILVVDDELDLLETMDLLLSQEGYQVTTAESGAAAVTAAGTHRFDLMITDLRMPGMSGAQTITQVKALQPTLRVIVATGFPSEETMVDCRRRGADEYLPKPFEFEQLLQLIHRLTRRHQPD